MSSRVSEWKGGERGGAGAGHKPSPSHREARQQREPVGDQEEDVDDEDDPDRPQDQLLGQPRVLLDELGQVVKPAGQAGTQEEDHEDGGDGDQGGAHDEELHCEGAAEGSAAGEPAADGRRRLGILRCRGGGDRREGRGGQCFPCAGKAAARPAKNRELLSREPRSASDAASGDGTGHWVPNSPDSGRRHRHY